jgi:hypothetical protein
MGLLLILKGCTMAIHRTKKATSKMAKAPTSSAAVKLRRRKPAETAVPKVAARVAKGAEIRLVKKLDGVVTDVTHTAQVYRGMERDGTDRLQALLTSYGHLLEGTEEIQHRMWAMVQQSAGTVLTVPREFANCRSFTDVAKKQQDLVQGFLGHWVWASHAMLTASRRVVDRAIRPLESEILDTAG